MKDVARLAGVSVQTVSCVVNAKAGITQETQERVRDAIRQLGYRPYTVARSLRTRETRTIALLLSDVANPSFATMAGAAGDHAHAFGYSLVLYNTHDDIEREGTYLRTAIDRWIDGIVFVSVKDHMKSLELLRAAEIPSVAIDRIPDGYGGPPVTLDNVNAGRMAAEHLLDLGHVNIAHISGPLWLRLARERQAGFLEALKERGFPPGQCVPSEGTWECRAGYEAMRRILECRPLPTGVFSANDRMAIGAMSAIRDTGLRVPDDISIIGLDDIEVSSFQNPPLTTIRQSFVQLATLGVQLLLDILAGREPVQPQVMIEPSLIVRQSSAPPRRSDPLQGRALPSLWANQASTWRLL